MYISGISHSDMSSSNFAWNGMDIEINENKKQKYTYKYIWLYPSDMSGGYTLHEMDMEKWTKRKKSNIRYTVVDMTVFPRNQHD